MKTKYLINKGYYIKDNLKSFVIYFDYFSQGLSLPKPIQYSVVSKIVHKALKIFVILSYLTKMYTLFYRTTMLQDNAIIIIKGKGEWRNIIKLVENRGGLVIRKKIKNSTLFKKEMTFYKKYKVSDAKIKLPKCSFDMKNNIIEMEFLKLKSFQRYINEGEYNFKKSLLIFEKIKSETSKLYKSTLTLIHGDLWPENIYISNDNYYLIDFTDSRTARAEYDSYTLLYAILVSFKIIEENEKRIANVMINNESVPELLNVMPKDLVSIESEFISYRKTRFPRLYE